MEQQELPILKGNIYITSDIDIVYNFPIGENSKIISLDEDDILHPDDINIFGGSCLLPPVIAKIAESDGDEYQFNMIYRDHLLQDYQQEFISVLIAALYKGKNLLLFMPELGYTYSRDRLCYFMLELYGIHMAIIDNKPSQELINNDICWYNCWYDNRCIPVWLNLIYIGRVISPNEYLRLYPIDADLRTNPKVMDMLIRDLNPYTGKEVDSYNSKVEYILGLHKRMHKCNKALRLPIHRLI